MDKKLTLKEVIEIIKDKDIIKGKRTYFDGKIEIEVPDNRRFFLESIPAALRLLRKAPPDLEVEKVYLEVSNRKENFILKFTNGLTLGLLEDSFVNLRDPFVGAETHLEVAKIWFPEWLTTLDEFDYGTFSIYTIHARPDVGDLVASVSFEVRPTFVAYVDRNIMPLQLVTSQQDSLPLSRFRDLFENLLTPPARFEIKSTPEGSVPILQFYLPEVLANSTEFPRSKLINAIIRDRIPVMHLAIRYIKRKPQLEASIIARNSNSQIRFDIKEYNLEE